MTTLAVPEMASVEPVQDAQEENEWPTRRWTRTEYYRAAAKGVFKPDERLQLLEGEIIQKVSPQNTPHAAGTWKTHKAVETIFEPDNHVRVQMPLHISEKNEPEPDVMAVRGQIDDYAGHPRPADVLLLVEVSDSTVRLDQTRKAAIYARAAIADYWLLNLTARVLEVRRDPVQDANGKWRYQTLLTLTETEAIAPLHAPQSPVRVADLPPVETSMPTEITIPPEEILQQLGSRRKAVRQQGIQSARRLSPEQFVQLVKLEHHQYGRNRWRWWIAILLPFLCGFYVIYCFAAVLSKDAMFMLFITSFFSPMLIALWPNRAHNSLMQSLCKTNDATFLFTTLDLLAELHLNEAKMRTNLRLNLRDMIPNVPIEVFRKLSPHQRLTILWPLIMLTNSRLNKRQRMVNASYTLVLLKYLEQAGDQRDIPAVQGLAKLRSRRPEIQEVIQAAQKCLPYLEICADAEKQSQTLLRASEAVTAAPAILLRPAEATSETPADQLLRPTE